MEFSYDFLIRQNMSVLHHFLDGYASTQVGNTLESPRNYVKQFDTDIIFVKFTNGYCSKLISNYLRGAKFNMINFHSIHVIYNLKNT